MPIASRRDPGDEPGAPPDHLVPTALATRAVLGPAAPAAVVAIGHTVDTASVDAGQAPQEVLGRLLGPMAARLAGVPIGAPEVLVRTPLPVASARVALPAAQVVEVLRDLDLDLDASQMSVGVVPERLAARGRILVVLDVDSTFIQDEVIELLAAHAGREQEVAAVTEGAMRGELDFAESLRERVDVLAGLEEAVLDQVRDAVRPTPGAAELARGLLEAGHAVALASGGFAEVVGPLAARLGVPHVRANALSVRDGRLTGELEGPIVDRAAKAHTLRAVAEAEGIPLERTVAVGDGANDAEMLDSAALAVAFNAKPALKAHAHLVLDAPRLDVLLPVLGVRRPA